MGLWVLGGKICLASLLWHRETPAGGVGGFLKSWESCRVSGLVESHPQLHLQQRVTSMEFQLAHFSHLCGKMCLFSLFHHKSFFTANLSELPASMLCSAPTQQQLRAHKSLFSSLFQAREAGREMCRWIFLPGWELSGCSPRPPLLLALPGRVPLGPAVCRAVSCRWVSTSATSAAQNVHLLPTQLCYIVLCGVSNLS